MSAEGGERVIASKLANALFPKAQLGTAVGFGLGLAGVETAVRRTLTAFSLAYGGLWVGGRVTLTDRVLRFEPNRINRMMHESGGDLRFELPLDSLRSATRRFGFFTGIVDVATDEGAFSLRCYGADQLAEQIRQTAKLG